MIGLPFKSKCPHCGYEHTGIVDAEDTGVTPSTGDTSLCIRCGKLCIIDMSLPGKMRVPTDDEQAETERDPLWHGMLRAWKYVKGLH